MEAKYIIIFVLISIQTLRAAEIGKKELDDRILDPKNYEKNSRSPEFLKLDYSEILELLKSDIAVSSETIVFNSVKKWINHESDSRKQYLDELSDFIRFENLPKNVLLSESNDFCSDKSSHKCHAKILNALQQKEDNNFESADSNFRDSYSTLMAVGSFYPSKSKIFEIFDLRNEKWMAIKNFKCDKVEYSAVLLDHKIMLIGGENDRFDTVNTVESYDLNTGAMENLPSMKYARKALSAVEFNGRVYAMGGKVDFSNVLYVEMWDPALKTWQDVSPMSSARHGFQAVVLDGEILVVGGGGDAGLLSNLESYNPVTGMWRNRTSMNDKRENPGVAVVDGYVYAVGGQSRGFNFLNTAEKYDPVTDQWTKIHSLDKNTFATRAANLFGKLVIVGGSITAYEEMKTMEMYDDENGKWISMPPLNHPRSRHNVIEIPWRLAKATLSREVPK